MPCARGPQGGGLGFPQGVRLGGSGGSTIGLPTPKETTTLHSTC